MKGKSEGIEIKPPEISEETKQKMIEFFLKTSIPRILAEKKGGEEE